ncbi:MAG: MlaD family protein [Burkholderiales bacterium]
MNFAIVGAFVLALGAALVAGALWLASGGASRTAELPYLALVDESVAGLNINAPVKLNGVDVGKVRGIELDPANPARVRLTFAIEDGTPIKEDTVAVLKTQGLTGIAYVEMSGGTRDSPPLAAVAPEILPVIRIKPSLSARLENVLSTVLAKLDSTSTTIDALLSPENRRAFSSALADIAVVSQTLAARKDTLDAGIASAAASFGNAERASAQLGPVIERVGRSAEAVEKMGNEAALASAGAGKAIDAVGAEVRRAGADTLPQLQRLIGELSVLSTSMRRLVEQTERNPASLIVGRSPAPVGPGETAAGTGR